MDIDITLTNNSFQEGFLLGKTVLQTVQVNNDVQSAVPLEQRRIGEDGGQRVCSQHDKLTNIP